MNLWGSVAVTNRGTNIPAPLFERGLGTVDLGFATLNLTLLAALAVVAGSFWVNRRLVAAARAQQEATGVRPATWWKSILILFGPFIALMAALGFHLEVPELKGFNFTGGILVALIAMFPWYVQWAPNAIWKTFDLFVGLIQAFIFALLTILYFSQSMELEDEHH